LAHKDPKVFLLALMNDLEADVRIRADAAKALMPFMHNKLGEGGKKDQQQDAAKKIAGGKFAAAAPPRLVSNNVR
jgi:phage terminase small subunit